MTMCKNACLTPSLCPTLILIWTLPIEPALDAGDIRSVELVPVALADGVCLVAEKAQGATVFEVQAGEVRGRAQDGGAGEEGEAAVVARVAVGVG